MIDYAIPEMVNTIISTLILPLLVLLTKYSIEFFKSKSDEAKARTCNENCSKYINIAEDAVLTAVTVVSQTYVETLKKQGSFDEASQREAFEMAKSKAVLIMGDAAHDFIASIYTDVNTWLDHKLEYYVNKTK